jgi:hypothetical protein
VPGLPGGSAAAETSYGLQPDGAFRTLWGAGRRTPARAIADYDASLAAHYTDQGRETVADAWTGVIGLKFDSPRRPNLAKQLKQQGFDFN